MIYLDWAATSLADEKIYRDSLELALKYQGNPSSQHEMGRQAREQLEELRERAAQVLGCEAQQLYLTSGGTESNNLAISSLLHRNPTGEILYSSIEHPAVAEAVKALSSFGLKSKAIQPDPNGQISAKKLQKKLSDETRMVCVMGVHNTTGAIQPIKELAQTVREFEEGKRPVHFHCDMVQCPGKIPFNLKDLNIDSASFSGHKLGAPRGTGFLFLKKPIPPVYRGGGQERGIRPGTESLQNMAALTLALEKYTVKEVDKKLIQLADYLIDELRKSYPTVSFNPPARETDRQLFIPQVINFSLPPLPGEVLHRILDQAGVAISHGSACAANGRKKPEDLHSMGIPPKTAHCSVRVSLGPGTTKEDLDQFLRALKKQTQNLGLL